MKNIIITAVLLLSLAKAEAQTSHGYKFSSVTQASSFRIPTARNSDTVGVVTIDNKKHATVNGKYLRRSVASVMPDSTIVVRHFNTMYYFSKCDCLAKK